MLASKCFSLRALALTCSLITILTSASAETLVFEHVTITAGDPAENRQIEDGSIIVRDGLIVAIGPTSGGSERANALTAPPGARVIDGKGLYAVPAFIDAFTRAGVTSQEPSSRNEGREPDFRKGPTPSMHRALRRGLRPELGALDLFDPSSDELDKYRKQGFATLHVVPSRTLLAGAGAVVSLSGAPLREVVLRERTGVAASFRLGERRYGHYPSSLMGAVAHLRQFFLDAAHHSRWKVFFAENSRGVERPPRDTALDALEPLLRRRAPLFFEADRAPEIRRALDFTSEFQLRTWICGGRDAADVTRRLAAEAAAVVLTMDLGDEPEVKNEPGQPPPRVQEASRREWLEDMAAAQALHEASVPFAFATGDQEDPAKLLQRVKRARKEGLASEQALRALTLGAAEALGVDELVGSIDEGKVASVALLDAPFADDSARVRYLLADGALFEYELPERKDDEKDDGKDEAGEKDEAKPQEEREEAEKEKAPGKQVTECELDEDRRPSLQTGGDVYIRDATVITLAGVTYPEASIRVRDGKIEAVGPNVGPEGIDTVIDASGWYVMPGIIDCHSHMATRGGVNESSESITCEVRIDDVIDPRDVTIYRALAGGVTAAHVLHGSANAIGGQCRLIKLKYGRPANELKVRDIPQTVKFALGENVKQSNFSSRLGSRFPVTRQGVEATFRRAFSAALKYEMRWNEHARALSRGERSLEPRRDLRLEALLKVLRGQILVHCHSYRADEILMLMRVATDFDFRVQTFQHILEGYKVAPELAAHGAMASTFSDWWAYKFEVIDAIPYNGAIMHRAGVVVTFNSDSDELVRHLNLEAAKAIRYGGVSPDEALKFVTLNAARQLAAEEGMGTIEVGKDADLAIYDAHPLSVYSRVRYTLIDGEVYFENRDLQRKNPYANEELVEATDFLPQAIRSNEQGLYAIQNAIIHTLEAEPMRNGTVVIEDGVVAAVGLSNAVEIPEGATVLDAKGLHLYPGLIDAGTNLGLVEINSVRGSVDLGETGSMQPDLRMATAVNVHSELIPVTRSGGITIAAVFNSRSGIVAGQPAVIRLAGSSTPEAIVEDRLGLQVNVRGANRDGEEPDWVEELAELLEQARRYEAAAQAGEPLPPDERLEALLPIVRRERPVIFTAEGEAALRLVVQIVDRLNVRAILRGARDGWKVADLLAEKDIPVIVGPVHALPRERHDPHDAPYRNAARLHEAGVRIAFQSNDESNCRNLPNQVGTAVAWGLPHRAALQALTSGAAEILGLGEHTGRLQPGYAANLILTDGDPLQITTHVHHMFIAGEPTTLESRHTRLYRQFRKRLEVPELPARQPPRQSF